MNRYGVCVRQCPQQFETIKDYEDANGDASKIKGGQPMRHPEDPNWFLADIDDIAGDESCSVFSQ